MLIIRMSAGEALLLLSVLYGVPILYLVDFILYRNVFKRTEKNKKSFMLLKILWIIFWVVPIPLFFSGWVALGFVHWSMLPVADLLLRSGFFGFFIMMLVLKIAMLVVGLVELRKSKEKSDRLRRRWLLIAFFVPLIGSILFFKIGKDQIADAEMYPKTKNSNIELEEIGTIFKD